MAENRLAKESSPYLLQHASNPVDWHAWGPEALKMARDKNMPIFLSVGYSSCHWCHVMAHESFENEEIARLLNENFVSIKVDREERPDIDDVYQRACQMASGQGGWPLSAFLTPDQKPFYVGTYFPPMDSYGRPGFGSLAARLAQSWKEKPSDVQAAAEKFAASLSREPEPAASPESPGQQALDEAAVNLLHAGDSTYGGFGQAPKFPSAANISFLFRYGAYSRVSKFHEFALMTLRRMAKGGIFDQIGGGFHRYSTDARWLVPHFEKMLYDNALIPINYVEAYQITGDAFYLGVAEKTLDFVLREMASPEGCFYSAYDADSKGGEGSFYTWKKSEVRSVLGDGPDFEAFCLYYDVTDGGNWESRTILCRSIADSAAAFKLGTTEQELREAMARCSARLLEARSARPRPGLDEKAITSWNALMISAMTAGFCASGDGRYLDAAESCISFIEQKMSPQGRLLHTYKDGTAKIPGYLDDYAYYVAALLDAFGATAQARYLERAAELADEMLGQFWDGTAGFYTTSGLHEGLIARTKSVYDLSVPSGSSVAAGALLRLYHMDGSRRFLGPAEALIGAQSQAAAENPFGFGRLLCSMFDMVQEVPEVTVMDKQGSMSSQLYKRFLPGAAIVRLKSQSELDCLKGRAFFAGKEFSAQPSAYVCRGSACTPPITDAEQAAGLASPRRQP